MVAARHSSCLLIPAKKQPNLRRGADILRALHPSSLSEVFESKQRPRRNVFYIVAEERNISHFVSSKRFRSEVVVRGATAF